MLNGTNKLSYLKRILGDYTFSHNTNEASFFCPYCKHRKRKLAINIETDKFHCWVCSKAGSSVFFLIRDIDSTEKAKEYNELFSKRRKSGKKTAKNLPAVKVPEYYQPLVGCEESILSKRAIRYLTENREIKKEDLLFYKIGVISDGPRIGGIVFPSFSKYGEINFWIIRNIGNNNLKHIGPLVDKDYKNQIIINEINIDWNKPVIIVEGFIDMIKSGERNVIPLCGSFFSKKTRLFSEILKHKPKVYLALDADAKKKTQRIARNLVNNEIETYVVDVSPYEDVGEMNYILTDYIQKAIMIDEAWLFRQKMEDSLR